MMILLFFTFEIEFRNYVIETLTIYTSRGNIKQMFTPEKVHQNETYSYAKKVAVTILQKNLVFIQTEKKTSKKTPMSIV